MGANLMQLLLSVQEEEWDDVDLAIRAFQRMTAAIKFCPRPVVVAPFGFCLGGGAEIALHRRAAAGACRVVHGAGGDRRRRAAGGRRLQGDDAARAGCGCGGPRRRGRIVELLEALKRTSRRSRWRRCRPRRWRRGSSGFAAAGRPHHDESRAAADRCEGTGARHWRDAGYAPPVPRTDIPGAGREYAGDAEAGRPHDAAGRIHQRPRCEGGELGGAMCCAAARSRRARR